jgi:hypothetical protein
MESMFPPEMAKYNLEFDFMNPVDSVVKLVQTVWSINEQIDAAKESDSEKAKVATHPYDVKASKDSAAAKQAQSLINAFIAACDAAIAKNANVAWHLAQTDSTVTQYLTSEMQYWRSKADPKRPVTSGSKLDELREDRKVLTQLTRQILSTFVPVANALMNDDRVEKEDGKIKLPNLQGSGTRNPDVVTGRHAKYRQTKWTIGNEEFPIGTDPRDLVRAIWTGAERVGKKPSDLFEPIDKARKNAKPGEVVTIKLNGKQVTYQEVDSK